MKEKIFNIIQIGDKSNTISRFFDIFITITIFSNIIVTFLQTFDELAFMGGFFKWVEYITLFIFCVEYDAQPDIFRNAFSGIWWSMSTLLTVGYGDIYPVTTLGRIMAICIAYLGVGAVAIPTGIISAGFVEQYQRKSSISDIKNADIREIAESFGGGGHPKASGFTVSKEKYKTKEELVKAIKEKIVSLLES